MRILRAGRWFPPFLFWCGATHALAASGEDSFESADREIETVQVTATRVEASGQDVSAAISAVKRDSVWAETPDVLPEMLRGLPGIYFQQTTPGQGIPVIRGLKGSQILHLVDGMRINNAFFRDAPNQYLGLVDALAIARTEVVRGASGSLYGADAMGGVVNFLTPEPQFEGQDWLTDSHLYGAWNSADHALASRLDVQGGNAGHSIVGGFSYQDHGDRKTGNGQTLRPSGYRSRAADLKWITRLSSQSELKLSVQALEQPSTPRVDELLPGFGQENPGSSQFEFQPNRRSFLHANYNRYSDRPWLNRVQVDLARQVITDDRLTQDFGSPLVTTEQNESRLDGLTAQLDLAAMAKVFLSAGVEFYADTVRSQRQRLDQDTGLHTAVESRFPDQSSMDSTAAWVSAEWHPGERWTLRSGLRYSHFEIRLPGALQGSDVALSPDDVSGDLRFVYQLSESVNIVGNLGRGFRPPNIFDLGTLGNRPGNRFNTANPSLRPESVHSFDLGLKSETANWQSELFVFYLDYRDKITSVETGDITESGRVVVRSENLSSANIYGIEAGFRGFLDSGLLLYATLNYTRGKEESTAGRSPADRIPPMNGKAGINALLPGSVALDAYLLFSTRQDRLSDRDATDPRINPLGTAGWGTVNLALTWSLKRDLQLGVKLENLADKAYREHGSGIDAPARNLGVWARKQF